MRARDEERAGTDGPLYPTLRLLRQAARLQCISQGCGSASDYTRASLELPFLDFVL